MDPRNTKMKKYKRIKEGEAEIDLPAGNAGRNTQNAILHHPQTLHLFLDLDLQNQNLDLDLVLIK